MIDGYMAGSYSQGNNKFCTEKGNILERLKLLKLSCYHGEIAGNS
jgi:hypothetical protein